MDATHKDYNAVFWFSFVVSICLYIVLFFSAPLIASFYDRQELVNLSRVIFASFLFSGMAIVPHVILFKQLQVKMQAKIDVFALFLSGMCGVFWHSMVSLIGHWQFKVRCMWQVHLC